MRILTCCQVLLIAVTLPAAADNAETHYRRGVALGEDARRASVFRKISLAKEARAEFERAVQLDPNFLDARFALVEFDMLAPAFIGGGEERAIAQANEIKKRDAIEGHHAFAVIYQHQKRPDLARREYVDAVRDQPSSPKAHYWLGVSFFSDKNYARSNEEFETAVKLDPKYMPAWFQIGHTAALSGTNLDRGEEALRKYLTSTPAFDEPPLYRAHFWLGAIYEKIGKKAEARASDAASLKANPEQKDVREALKRVS